MKRVLTSVFALATVALSASKFPLAAAAADRPADRVVVMCFHRVPGCATCQKMTSYCEEAVQSGFAQQLKDGTVELHVIDFEDPKNAALTKGYKVSSPTLVVAKVAANKVAKYQPLTESWSKVPDKKAFIDYVQSNVKDYQK
jgi:hypothetical protein